MKVGRPPKPETPYKVLIHNNGGRRYASTKVVEIDGDGKKFYRHKHWGSIDKNNIFHPNTVFLTTPVQEREKLIFPPEIIVPHWDSEEDTVKSDTAECQLELQDMEIISGPISDEADSPLEVEYNKFIYGPIWFLEQVADVTGVIEDLMRMFDDNRELVSEILTYAYYFFIMEPRPALEVYQQYFWSPANKNMGARRIISMLSAITPEHRMDLFRCNCIDEAFIPSPVTIPYGTYGSMFVSLVEKILASFLKTVWSKNKDLKKKFEAPEDIVDCFRGIRCSVRQGRLTSITHMDEEQLDICRHFGFRPPKIR